MRRYKTRLYTGNYLVLEIDVENRKYRKRHVDYLTYTLQAARNVSSIEAMKTMEDHPKDEGFQLVYKL